VKQETRRETYLPSDLILLAQLSQNLLWCQSACQRLEMLNSFVEPGANVNGAYYRDVLISQNFLPAIRSIAGETFTFQQNNALAHRACDTVELSFHCGYGHPTDQA